MVEVGSTIAQADVLSWLRRRADHSVDVIVTSPPYNIGVAYDGDTTRDKRKADDYIKWSVAWITEALRVSRRGIILNLGAAASNHNLMFRLLGAIAERFFIQNVIVWVKSVHVGDRTMGHFKPLNSERFVNNTHEYVFHVTADGKQPLNKLAVGVPYADKSNLTRFTSASGGKAKADKRCRGSVWFLPYETRKQKKAHPATYPVELAEWMIKLSGAEGSVCDPFVGSGSTAVAAKRLGLAFRGCDVSKAYVAMARAAAAAEKGKSEGRPLPPRRPKIRIPLRQPFQESLAL